MTSFTGFTWVPAHSTSDTPLADPVQIANACAKMQWTDEQLDDPNWFAPSPVQLHDPMKMAGMEEAVKRLQQALHNNERVRIITDYDVDGTTSSLILQATLRILQPNVQLDYHIPDRFNEGYGFSTQAAEAAVADGVNLIVTADIGVRDQASVDIAKTGGVDVLICDHHLPSGADVPTGALVLCPPQKACDYPNPHLAACGVSLKLAQAMLTGHKSFQAIFQSMLKLAAIGTVSDMVPLTTGENRAIVTLGLRSLNEDRHTAGLTALLDVARAKRGKIDEGTVGYQVGPRINAAGRMADAKIVIEMINCRDPIKARTMAQRVDGMNTERRAIQEGLVQKALEQLTDPPPVFVMAAGPETEGWHRGVVGIVAARLMRSTHRPSAVISIQGDIAVGSMRSIDGVHCVDLLDSVSDLLTRYGGHPKAAGFSVPTQHLETFRERMCSAVEGVANAEILNPKRAYALELLAPALVIELTTQLKRLGPFGIGNQKPLFLVRGVKARNIRTLSEGKHLKFQIQAGPHPVEVIWWNQGELTNTFQKGPVDLLGSLSVNEWNGRQNLQFLLTDARAH